MKKTLFFLITIVSVTVFAQGIKIPQSFKARFVQTVTSPDKATIRYEGKVRFSKPARLKWIYEKPTKKEVCTDGKELLVVDHELEQVSYYRMAKTFDLSAILSRAKPSGKRIYTATYDGKLYTLRVDKQGRLDSVAFFDDTENKVQLLFTHIQTYNKPFNDALMRCNYPASYDVIEG